jgi:hypothetical protein
MIMPNQSSTYILRGQRVMPLGIKDVQSIASETARVLKVNRSTLGQMDQFMEQLGKYGITVDPVADNEWLHITKAMCHNRAICMPESLYIRICKSEPEAIFIFFHELGHLMLGHQASLHYSDIEPTQQEDAEWQADEYSKTILSKMGISYMPEQLNLRF